MLKTIRPFLLLFIGISLALLSALLGNITITPAQGNLSAAAFQVTSAPTPVDHSKIGSTDGIAAMGFVIALIIIIPVLLQYLGGRKETHKEIKS